MDVGCGTGLVMQLFSTVLDVRGVDLDARMVGSTREKGFEAVQADAMELPFDDATFDVVYCSYTLLWVEDPQKAIQEMTRVARDRVVCLAEPDYGGRICVPQEVADLDDYLVGSMIAEGADPYMGRKLGMLMERAGLRTEVGVHSGAWSCDRLREEADAEWNSISKAVRPMIGPEALDSAKSAWDRALADRSLFLYNPVLFAVGSK